MLTAVRTGSPSRNTFGRPSLSVAKKADRVPDPVTKIPTTGRDRGEILKDLDTLRADDADWHAGRTFSLVYHRSDEHSGFLKEVYGKFFSENALNPVAFGSLRQMEAQVVRMTADMLNGDEHVAGTMTSGGSESIMVAVKTYRDWGIATKGVTRPNMVLPLSAHPAFTKAGHYVGVEIRHVDCGEDLRADVAGMAAAIDDQTVAIVGSAPGYPHGVIDDITALGALAKEHGIGMHVDGCLGGFMLPWVEQLGADVVGHDIPPFDFRVDGVTSISADVHKYGFAAKGASTILYRDADLRRHQFHAATNWPGGIYVSPTAAGTRPGGSIAAAWAALNAIGVDGYLAIAKDCMATTRRLMDGVRAIEGLHVLGEPQMTVFGFTGSDDVDVYAVGDQLDEMGWNTDRLIKPAALHLMITPVHAPIVDDFLADLAKAVDIVRADPSLSTQGQAAMYGAVASIPDGEQDQIEGFVLSILDGFYDV